MRTAALYVVFAILATAVNLGTQMLVELAMSGEWATVVAVLAGTLTGVITKYVLDKRWIFRHETMNAAHGLKTFFLYGVMSGVTTLIFWGFEFGFDALFGTDVARYTGAVIGLAIGYVAKYHLDKNVTFSGPREEPA
ncbi:GtrA family protein [Rathayibacter sp. VKM Ac-2856]|jgi:putative flippase GtrA|uniref:GtrA family protein n=1 Tax=unclassified Rathayibacter TaxID=2609250 RepID=UPI001567C5A9|nr:MULTISPECIES: GtrA family protein [unclassified Rathayibacter]NQX05854.1 GtrA family protein [Rathayibacter sp. VKM Ac-2858]NQX21196.1 GtrA family protein [Rathayibacter sp. VKM Ac-2856]